MMTLENIFSFFRNHVHLTSCETISLQVPTLESICDCLRSLSVIIEMNDLSDACRINTPERSDGRKTRSIVYMIGDLNFSR